jgi:hypothetical protein
MAAKKRKRRHPVEGKKTRAFTSPGGRRFVLGAGKEEPIPSDVLHAEYPILRGGKRVGTLWRTAGYGRTKDGGPRYTATVNQLQWMGELPPTGLGFDVAAFDSPDEALRAWGRSADQILNFRAGTMTDADKAMFRMYNHNKTLPSKPARRRR